MLTTMWVCRRFEPGLTYTARSNFQPSREPDRFRQAVGYRTLPGLVFNSGQYSCGSAQTDKAEKGSELIYQLNK